MNLAIVNRDAVVGFARWSLTCHRSHVAEVLGWRLLTGMVFADQPNPLPSGPHDILAIEALLGQVPAWRGRMAEAVDLNPAWGPIARRWPALVEAARREASPPLDRPATPATDILNGIRYQGWD